MNVQNYSDLIVWQKSMQLVELIYELTKRFPKEEQYGLTNQIRRAAVSIPSNIAEGQARTGSAEFRNFLSIASGSRAEVETQLLIAQKLGYTEDSEVKNALALSNEIKRMTHALIPKLK
jgi:four helix bundle protein